MSDIQKAAHATIMERNRCFNEGNGALSINEDMVAAAGFKLEDPITNALIGNLKGTLPTKKEEVNSVVCEVCDCKMPSAIVYQFHVNGAKHNRKLKALKIVNDLKASGEQGIELGKSDDPNAFRCETCSLTVNSAQQLEIHLAGAKHRNKAAKAGITAGSKLTPDVPDPDGPPSKKRKKEDPVTFECTTCNVIMNSEQQYDQHITSKKHLLKSKAKANPAGSQNNQQGGGNKFKNFRKPSGGRNDFNNKAQKNPKWVSPSEDRHFNSNFNAANYGGHFVPPSNVNNTQNSEESASQESGISNFKSPNSFSNNTPSLMQQPAFSNKTKCGIMNNNGNNNNYYGDNNSNCMNDNSFNEGSSGGFNNRQQRKQGGNNFPGLGFKQNGPPFGPKGQQNRQNSNQRTNNFRMSNRRGKNFDGNSNFRPKNFHQSSMNS